VLPFIIDESEIEDLPWYISHLRAEHVSSDRHGAGRIVQAIENVLKRRSGFAEQVSPATFKHDARVERLISNIKSGDWAAAEEAALGVLRKTDVGGRNSLFEALLAYRDCPDDEDVFWAALLVIESCADLAPWLTDYQLLREMAYHPNFSVRSTAASICLRFAQYAPDRAPVDLLDRLSAYDEDWYVERPAIAALQAMVRSVPGILRIFYGRLQSTVADERAQAAQALFDIATREAELLDLRELETESTRLRQSGDKEASQRLSEAVEKVRRCHSRFYRYKYGL